ncbi:hypothetical protein PVK06_028133 [Gossypium arboreum]|uniref:Uncharacterized protein n=1 Tax=Gossypium arboreum TaxID=29729 RepID=A0ABR0P3H7_GOSAR|nr:hypothetical protein PVK06_028133 [Gossypium arboreum]
MVVGKIKFDRVLNRKAILTILQGIWQSDEVLNVRDIGINIFVVSFATEMGMNQAMMDSSWTTFGGTKTVDCSRCFNTGLGCRYIANRVPKGAVCLRCCDTALKICLS